MTNKPISANRLIKFDNARKKQEALICIQKANSCLSDALGEFWNAEKMLIQNVLIGVTTLKNRGWNDAMIAVLGDPDKWAQNPNYRSGQLRALFSVSRVFLFEQEYIGQLKVNIEKRISKQQKLSENPPKPRKLTVKQVSKMSDALCETFCQTMPGKLINGLYHRIKEAAKTNEPWSSVSKVLAEFPDIYNDKQRPVSLDIVELRELSLGKNALCSFVFYISDENGITGGIMDWVEFKAPETINSVVVDAISNAASMARASRIKQIALASK